MENYKKSDFVIEEMEYHRDCSYCEKKQDANQIAMMCIKGSCDCICPDCYDDLE